MHLLTPVIYNREITKWKDEEKTIDENFSSFEALGADYAMSLDRGAWADHQHDMSLAEAIKDNEENTYEAFADFDNGFQTAALQEFARLRYRDHKSTNDFDFEQLALARNQAMELYHDALLAHQDEHDNNIRVHFIDIHM